jgi:hypothetical protein
VKEELGGYVEQRSDYFPERLAIAMTTCGPVRAGSFRRRRSPERRPRRPSTCSVMLQHSHKLPRFTAQHLWSEAVFTDAAKIRRRGPNDLTCQRRYALRRRLQLGTKPLGQQCYCSHRSSPGLPISYDTQHTVTPNTTMPSNGLQMHPLRGYLHKVPASGPQNKASSSDCSVIDIYQVPNNKTNPA